MARMRNWIAVLLGIRVGKWFARARQKLIVFFFYYKGGEVVWVSILTVLGVLDLARVEPAGAH